MKCPDLELRVLISTENVTDRVQKAVDSRATSKVQAAQRRAVTAAIEKESSQATGLQSRMVELYHGASTGSTATRSIPTCAGDGPERGIAFFGGDPDNSASRATTGLRVLPHLRERPAGAAGALVPLERTGRRRRPGVRAGNPGSTGRGLTVAQLEYLRDISHPMRIQQQEHRLAALRAYATQGAEPARRAENGIFGIENNLKRQRAFLEVLKDPQFMAEKRKDERTAARVAKNPTIAASYAGAWDRVAAAQRVQARRSKEYLYTTTSHGTCGWPPSPTRSCST